MTITRKDALDFIRQASMPDLDQIASAHAERLAALFDTGTRKIAKGAHVQLVDVSPQALGGMEGTVVEIQVRGTKTIAVVLLTAAFTRAYRYHKPKTGPQKRARVRVPLDCCRLVDDGGNSGGPETDAA